MAIKFTSTKDVTKAVKILVYGESGVGKTRLTATCPNPVIISSEKKLISLKDFNIPVILIENHEDLEEAYTFLTTSKKAKKFETIVLDSVSDIAEAILAYFKENPVDGNTHPQAAYGMLADETLPLIKKFRDIADKHIYFIAKAKRYKDEYSGVTSWAPMMPGQQLGPGLPYLFDFVCAMRIGENNEGKKYRYLQTVADLQYLAKGNEDLKAIEKPNLGQLFDKVLGKAVDEPEHEEEYEDEQEEKEVTEEVKEENETEGFEEA